MHATATETLMTTEQLLAMPDDGIERDLFAGQLKEYSMTRRSLRHCLVTVNLSWLLSVWLQSQPKPRGLLLAGDQGFRLRRDPDTTVGIDVAYISAELAARTPSDAFLIDGVPTLAIEILSASDKHEDIVEKLTTYLDCGVSLVWIVDPDLRTVTVYRPDADAVMFNARQELSAEPFLPGFRLAVASVFDA